MKRAVPTAEEINLYLELPGDPIHTPVKQPRAGGVDASCNTNLDLPARSVPVIALFPSPSHLSFPASSFPAVRNRCG
jgi:hypothetical protein